MEVEGVDELEFDHFHGHDLATIEDEGGENAILVTVLQNGE